MLEYAILKKKRDYFDSLSKMSTQDKVHLIDIDDELERQDLLAKFMVGEGIKNKQEYVPTLASNRKIRDFTD